MVPSKPEAFYPPEKCFVAWTDPCTTDSARMSIATLLGLDGILTNIAIHSTYPYLASPLWKCRLFARLLESALVAFLVKKQLRHIGDSACGQAKPIALLLHIQSTPKNAPAGAHAHKVVLGCLMWREAPTSPGAISACGRCATHAAAPSKFRKDSLYPAGPYWCAVGHWFPGACLVCGAYHALTTVRNNGCCRRSVLAFLPSPPGARCGGPSLQTRKDKMSF